jgi:hypothetical protein
MIEKYNGDAEKALCTALAYISGHYKSTMTGRSLLTGQEKSLSIELKSTAGKWSKTTSAAWDILKTYWPPKLTDTIKGMR